MNSFHKRKKSQEFAIGLKSGREGSRGTCNGIEDASVQQIHTQKYYQKENFVEGEKFVDMLSFENGSLTTMDLEKIQ